MFRIRELGSGRIRSSVLTRGASGFLSTCVTTCTNFSVLDFSTYFCYILSFDDYLCAACVLCLRVGVPSCLTARTGLFSKRSESERGLPGQWSGSARHDTDAPRIATSQSLYETPQETSQCFKVYRGVR